MASEMKKTIGTKKSWLAAGAALCVLLIVAAWFLLVSPVLAEASETRASTEDQEAKNDIARQEVAVLRADFARMDEYEAQLATLQGQITTSQRYADIQRLISDVAEDHNLTVTSLQFSTAEEVAPGAPPAPVEDEPEDSADSEQTEEEAAAAAEAEANAPAPEPSFPGLYSLDITIEFEGRYSDILAALNDLQTGDDRIMLLSGVRLAASEGTGEEAQGADGAVLQIDAETFVLVDPEYVRGLADPFAEFDPEAVREDQGPLPRSDDNPLTPVTE